jgi:hypothetical protein
MPFHKFSSLPLELVVSVLHQAGSPRDLLALLQTSKWVYQAFQYNSSSIVVAVIQNAMPQMYRATTPDICIPQPSWLWRY